MHVSAGTLADSLLEELPWTDHLPENDRARFAADFVREFRACAELGEWSTLNQLVPEWRDTALIHTDTALR